MLKVHEKLQQDSKLDVMFRQNKNTMTSSKVIGEIQDPSVDHLVWEKVFRVRFVLVCWI